ncbi:MAG: holo-ACP synthase [Planctomycetes bacterium]|nr:holo-ACP synthase [Planctomycetota bacterium]NUQ35710.1 holo-ACP synthase [Planctomycetaceae bacterium]
MIVGMGIDIVEVARVEALWRENPEAFTRRAFTDIEITYCTGRERPAQHLAARFAVKEAALKALGTGWAQGLGLRDVEVLRDEAGKPSLRLLGAAKTRADALGVTATHVSLSHTEHYACATVILEVR